MESRGFSSPACAFLYSLRRCSKAAIWAETQLPSSQGNTHTHTHARTYPHLGPICPMPVLLWVAQSVFFVEDMLRFACLVWIFLGSVVAFPSSTSTFASLFHQALWAWFFQPISPRPLGKCGAHFSPCGPPRPASSFPRA